MRPDDTQPQPIPAPRPIQRPVVSAMPVQRGNYGVPPRQTSRPTVDSFVRPTPPNPAPAPAPTPTAQQVAAPATSVSGTMPASNTAATPRFMDIQRPPAQATPSSEAPTAVAPTSTATTAPRHRFALLPKLRIALLVVGGLLAIGGAARWATAGNLSADTLAVGAVKANDTSSVTIQFTADDGQLHYLTLKGNKPSLVPGTAVQVAYQPGATDKTVMPVSKVTDARSLGVSIFVTGLVLLIICGVLYAWRALRHRKQQPLQQAHAVTA